MKIPKSALGLAWVLAACDSGTETGPPAKTLQMVQGYSINKGSLDHVDTTGGPVATYYFDAKGRYSHVVDGSGIVSSGDSAYQKAVNVADTVHVGGFAKYPPYDLIAAGKRFDAYGNLIFYVSLYRTNGQIDTGYYTYFVNHYSDGTMTGLF